MIATSTPAMHVLLSRCNSPETACVNLAHGVAVYSTIRSPAKESDNEDALAILPIDHRRSALAVADGVGGRVGGADAAQITLETIREAVTDVEDDEAAVRIAILNGIEAAQQNVIDLGIGAATTLAAVEVAGDTIRPYHIGDSEIMVVGRRGRVRFQSISHSAVAYAVEAGMLCPDEAVHHKDRHIISNAIGLAEMRIEIGPAIRLQRNDTVLLASDGLFDNLYLAEIVERIRKGPLAQAVASLTETALKRMLEPKQGQPSKPDDLTIIAFRQGNQGIGFESARGDAARRGAVI